MIVHLVLFRLKPGVGRDDRRLAALAEAMKELPAKIPCIRSWQHGFNLTADAEAWDYGLRAGFDSEVDLHAYFDHPAHLPVVGQWQEIAELAFADFQSE
jgi:hypothetical protein